MPRKPVSCRMVLHSGTSLLLPYTLRYTKREAVADARKEVAHHETHFNNHDFDLSGDALGII